MIEIFRNFKKEYFFNKNIFTLVYVDSELESNYKSSVENTKLQHMRYAPLITMVFYIIFSILDLYIAEPLQLESALNFHLSMIVVLLTPFIFSFFKSLKHYMFYSLAIAPIYALLGNVYLLKLGMFNYTPDLYLIMTWVFVMAGFFLYQAFIINLILVLFSLSLLFIFNIFDDIHLINHFIYIFVNFSIGLFAIYVIEFSSRINFEIQNTIVLKNIKIKNANDNLALAHTQIKDSIEYASLIQHAILPDPIEKSDFFKDFYAIWIPKNSVGGDIYFIDEISKDEVLVMVIDGAGHGVSGAFVTMLVKAIQTQILSDIANTKLEPSPALILEYFNKSIKTMLKQDKGSKSNAGFDGGILYYNRRTNKCKYSGAKTDLYCVYNDNLNIIKSDRKNVGFIRTKIDQKYTEHDIEIKEDTKLYISTDGLFDQEGKDDSRYGKSRFKEFIMKNNTYNFIQQKELLEKEFKEFKSTFEQSDDLSVLGLKF